MKLSCLLRRWFAVGLLQLVALPLVAAEIPFEIPLLWPEDQRSFVQDGPGLLVDQPWRDQLLELDAVGRDRMIEQFLSADPDPATAENELQIAIERRRALAFANFDTFLDHRARLMFLHGPPRVRRLVDCLEVYKPLEVWTYGPLENEQHLVLYRPNAKVPYQLWLPIDAKRVLYNTEMEYWLEQWEELRKRISGGRRFDKVICDDAKWVDEITGIDGLYGFMDERPRNNEVSAFLKQPANVGSWARAAVSSTPASDAPAGLKDGQLEVFFPQPNRQRMATRIMVTLPDSQQLEPFVEETPEGGKRSELRLVLEGILERDGIYFEDFRVRFQLPSSEEDTPVALIADRLLRPGQEFLLRLKVTDEISGRQVRFDRGFVVPTSITPLGEQPQVPEEALLAMGEQLLEDRLQGYNSLVLVPPDSDVVFGLWRAEALVTGDRIQKVEFYLDDAKIITRKRPPFTAELRLETYPTEQLVRAVGMAADGSVVSEDEVVVNQPRGELRVRVLEPARGFIGNGEVQSRVEIVVPEERKVASVEFSVNEELQITIDRPPWQANVEIPAEAELTYITVTAELDDGSRAEDVRFVNNPEQLEEVDVNLVELFTTVTERNGRLAEGLTAADFEIWEDGRPQKVAKFELVENLPLTLGIVVDTSGSMYESIVEAQQAAVGFLEKLITPKDRCFALGFADRPYLLMERTSDVGAVAKRLENLVADGSTSLHDAIVSSLYYYRGIRGRRALVLLSDGEDTSSSLEFKEALEYAKRSGVAVYSIGLRIRKIDVGVRRKLESLGSETGGRTFYIKEASELATVYKEIETELRSQYLVAYSSDRPGATGQYRVVEVKVKGGKLKARTIRGYYS